MYKNILPCFNGIYTFIGRSPSRSRPEAVSVCRPGEIAGGMRTLINRSCPLVGARLAEHGNA